MLLLLGYKFELHSLKEGTSTGFIYKWNSKTTTNRTGNPILKGFIIIWYEVKIWAEFETITPEIK